MLVLVWASPMLQAKTTDNGFSGSKRPGRISAPRPLSVILDSGQIESCGTRNLAAHARRSVSTAEAPCALSAQKGPVLFAHRRTSAFLCQFWNFAARDRGSAPLAGRIWHAISVVHRLGAAESRTTAIPCREVFNLPRECGSAPFSESRTARKRGCAPLGELRAARKRGAFRGVVNGASAPPPRQEETPIQVPGFQLNLSPPRGRTGGKSLFPARFG